MKIIKIISDHDQINPYSIEVEHDGKIETVTLAHYTGFVHLTNLGNCPPNSDDDGGKLTFIPKQADEQEELLEALQGMVTMYESVEPAGGWQGQYDTAKHVINKYKKS